MPGYLYEVGAVFDPASWTLPAELLYLLDFEDETNPVLYEPNLVTY